MRKLFLTVFLLVLLSAVGAVYYVFGAYSEGYRMGMLSSFASDGYIPFFKSGEGQMLLGRESSPLAMDYKTSDGNIVSKDFNPWHFSTNQKEISKYQTQTGRTVWLYYKQHRYNLSPLRNTVYEAIDVAPVSNQSPTPPFCETEKPMLLGRSEGVRAGRIVKASTKGNVIDTWEVVLQVGEAGNQFKPMSVDNRQMYDFAVQCLKSGKMVTVSYVDKGVLKIDFDDTPYAVWRIEVVKN